MTTAAPSAATPAGADDGPVAGDGGPEVQKSTRERILDIALDLFIEKGYDKTSLREIAAELGFSKAAVYYHFSSKEEILLALHQRLHDFGAESLRELGENPDPRAWAQLLDRFIERMLADRKLFELHERNRAALEAIHAEGHEQQHEDMGERFRAVLANPAVPARDRVRLACALGAVMGGLLTVGEAFEDLPKEELAGLLREAVADLLAGAGEPTS